MINMNQLANYCNELFLAEETSLYHFCKSHDLERTSIRRLLKGERLPKEEVFEAFANALSLTPEESRKLHELYQRQKLGTLRYENRIFIKEFLDEIGANYISVFQFFKNVSSSYDNNLIEQTTMKIDHPLELSRVFQHLLLIEEKYIYSNIPVSKSLFFESVQQIFYSGKQSVPFYPFYHFLTLLKKTDIQSYLIYICRLQGGYTICRSCAD